MRNDWGVEVKRGFYVWASGPRNAPVEGRVVVVDTRNGRAVLDSGDVVSLNSIRQVLPPMTRAEDGTVSVNPSERATMKHSADWWREECNYISRVTDKKGRVREMNNSTATFRRYCEMQRDMAEREGAYDAATYIQECIDDLPGSRSSNPTPRLKRADQPSQRERIGKTGKPTKRASERLKRRRALTHYADTPGVWANPLTRVKVKSPSQRTKEAPDSRLLKRRKVTAKAPPGFYANPVMMSEGPEYEIHVEAKKSARGQWAPVAMFPRGEVGAAMAKAYARALHGAHPTWAIRVSGPK